MIPRRAMYPGASITRRMSSMGAIVTLNLTSCRMNVSSTTKARNGAFLPVRSRASGNVNIGGQCEKAWGGKAVASPLELLVRVTFDRGLSLEKVTIGNAELYCGDCAVILPQLEPVDLILTDPPYGIGAGKMNLGKWRTSRMEKTDWDKEAPALWLLMMMLEKGENAIIFGGNYFELPPSRNYLIWDKGAGFKGRDFAECEFAWCSWDGNARLLQRDPLACGDYKQKEHPTQKPTKLMEWCIDLAPKAETICDPFMGSGTTGVAAMNLEKRFIGIERERKYFDVACARLDAAQAQGRLAL